MPLSDVVNVSISLSSPGPTREAFGVPLIAAYKVPAGFQGLTNTYSNLTDLTAAGFLVSDPAYLCAKALKSQSPSVQNFKIGRRVTSQFTQVLHLVCLNAVASGQSYNFSVGGNAVTYTTVGSANAVAAGLTTAINALSIPGLTATNPGSPSPNITITMTAGVLVDFKTDPLNLTFADATTFTATSLATDLASLLAADGGWYGLLLDSNSPAEILEAASWAESNGPVLFGTNCSDSAIETSSSGDVASSMKALSYARSFGLFSQSQLLSYSAAAWMGYSFTFPPGSINWAFKTLVGVLPDNLTTPQIHFVEGKNWSVYTTLAGLNLTQFGKTPSGEWIDITQSADFITNTIQVDVLSLLANNPKVPFTDSGIQNVVATVLGVLNAATEPPQNILSNNPAPFVSAPAAADVSYSNKSSRNLPNVTFSGTFQGAINTLSISGTLTQ